MKKYHYLVAYKSEEGINGFGDIAFDSYTKIDSINKIEKFRKELIEKLQEEVNKDITNTAIINLILLGEEKVKE